MKKIEWQIKDQEIKQDITSEDNRWHISRSQKGHDEPKLFLTNYDLLLTPHGTGKDYLECFQNFIKNCDQYVEQILRAKEEAKQHILVLENATEKIENED